MRYCQRCQAVLRGKQRRWCSERCRYNVRHQRIRWAWKLAEYWQKVAA